VARPSGPSPTVTVDARPSRGRVAARIALLIGIVVVVFGLVLPRIVDIDQVLAALGTLTPTQLGVLAVASAVAYVMNAAPIRVLMPALSWRRAVGADLAARAVASTIPGPTDVATRFVLYRQWDLPADTATAAILFAAFFETLSALALPAIASIGVVLGGQASRPTVVLLSALSLAALVLILALLSAIVRSESLARRVGELLDRVATRAWRLVHRTPPHDIVGSVLDIRVRARDTLSRHGALAYAAAVVAKLAWFLVLEVALWTVGVTPEVLPPAVVLAAMAAVALVALLPITPGGIGVTEVAYVGLLTAVAGDDLLDEITAAIVIFRAAQWFAPIPIGWILLVIMRGSHWRELSAPDAGPEGSTA
jgi:uncharacterized membrane protein YbhN (UPF0104 family)